MVTPRVSTGIANLDPLIDGGLKKNSINLVAGGPGTGKTIFTMHFLMAGLIKGEAAIYVTFEEKKKKFYEDMLKIGWDLQRYEDQGKFVFLEYTPEKVKQVLTEGGGVIEVIIEKIKANRLVIDSMTSFTLLYESELAKKEAALALFELIDKWNCTALMTSEDVSHEEDIIKAALEFEVDGVILLYHVKKSGLRKRGLEVLKMRGTKIPEKIIPLEITREGIKINPSGIEEI